MLEIAASFKEAARSSSAAPAAGPGPTASPSTPPTRPDPSTRPPAPPLPLRRCCPRGALFGADGVRPCSPVPSPVPAAVLLVGLHDRRLPTIVA
jgi:hypothetical protein